MDIFVYQRLFEDSSVGLVVIEFKSGRILSANQSFADIISYDESELKSVKYIDLTPKVYHEQEEHNRYVLMTTGKYGPYEKHLIDKNSQEIPIRVYGTLVNDDNDNTLILLSVESIEDAKKSKLDLQLSSLVFEHSSDAMMITNNDCKIIYVNPTFTKITGYASSDIIGKSTDILRSNEHDKLFYSNIENSLANNNYWQGEIWQKHKTGKIYAIKATINAVRQEKKYQN